MTKILKIFQKLKIKYKKITKINGNHPLKILLPSCYVPYNVRILENCEIAYFNFSLAKEMELINEDHEEEFTR